MASGTIKLWRGIARRTVIVAIITTFIVTLGGVFSFATWRQRTTIRKAVKSCPEIRQAIDQFNCNGKDRVIYEDWFIIQRITDDQIPRYAADLHMSQLLGETVVRGGWIAGIGAEGVLDYPSCGPLLIQREKLVLTRPILLGIATGIFCSNLLIIFSLTFLLLSRPISERINVLRKAAQAVGSSDFSWSSDGFGDPFDHFGIALQRAHNRISDYHILLNKRAKILEQHVLGISHDLRTPLSALRFSIDGVYCNDKGSQDLERAKSELEYIEQLIENISIDAILSGQLLDELAQESFDLRDVIEEIGVRAMAICMRKNQEVNWALPDNPVYVVGHYTLAMRALSNIADNALRHGRPGGHVAILLSGKGQKFRISVHDDGSGFDPAEIESLKVKGRKRLGLRIAKSCIEYLGWSLDLQSGPSGTKAIISGPIPWHLGHNRGSTSLVSHLLSGEVI